MTTQLNTHYPYSHHRPSISPPVSPKTQPHGYKRKASAQDDDAEPLPQTHAHAQAHISNSFKKLRLSEHARQARTTTAVPPPPLPPTITAPGTQPNTNTQPYAYTDSPTPATAIDVLDLSPIGISYRDTDTEPSFHHAPNYPSPAPVPLASTTAYVPHAQRNNHNDEASDPMPLDDTAHRVWIHDLDAEIRQIEAEEREQARNNNTNYANDNDNGIHILETGGAVGQDYYAKVPSHILRQGPKLEDPAAGLQMVLYRDPVSISVPMEEDAVRKAIVEARRRMREKQYGDRGVEGSFGSASSNTSESDVFSTSLLEDDAVDDMDID